MRKQHHIASFEQFCTMFRAGNGEFHLLNVHNYNQFNLKFRTIDREPGWSHFSACFTVNDLKMTWNYVKLGKFDFQDRQVKLLSEIQIKNFPRMFASFNYIVEHVYNGKPFPVHLQLYYSGTCCRCGAELHDTECLKRGFGSECFEKLKQEQPTLQFDLF